jgi:iron complex outermembrane receptor protein
MFINRPIVGDQSGIRIVLFSALATAFGAGPAYSQTAAPVSEAPPNTAGGLEEIIVTAQRRSENLQDVPIAVSAVTASTLETTGVNATTDIPQIVPSVQFTRSGASGLFFVRGVGTTNGSGGEEGANAVYVDGVYMADLSQTVNNFNNIERVEVLKGPQGTLFGRNATGGLIHVITREPGDQATLDAELGYGNYGAVTGRAYVAGPITDGVAMDLALTKTYQDRGWGRNLTLNRENKIQNFQGVRSKLALRPSDSVKFVLAGDWYENEDNLTLGYRIARGTVNAGGATPPPGQWDTTLNDYPLTRQEIWGVSLTGEADLGFATLTSLSAYRKTRNHSDFDVDGGPAPLLRIAFVSGLKSFQQEVRLASNRNEPLAWQIGGFYLHSEASNDSRFTGALFTPSGIRGQHILGNLETDSYALFGEATYSLTPTTKLTGGIRYTKDERHLIGSQQLMLPNGTEIFSGSATVPSGRPLAQPGRQDTTLSYDAFTWRIALRQEITRDISVYASANKGFKSGSFSLQNPLNDAYLPQSIMAYEVGVKSEIFDRKLRLNVSAFHYDIDDYQVRSAAVTNGVPGASLILNAATVKVDGAELEFEAAPTQELRIFGGVTWLDSRYHKFGGPDALLQAPITYPNANSSANPLQRTRCVANGTREPGVVGTGPLTGGFTTCFGDVSGLQTMNAPEFVASLGASYTVEIGDSGSLRFTGLYNYNSGYVFEPDNRQAQDSYSLVNGSIEYRPVENFGIELWGRNLANTKYAIQKVSTSNIAVTEAVGAPRTYGVNLKIDF